jgi:hypothetical protein
MQIIPLKAAPNQTVTVGLSGQVCQINVRQRRTGLFLDLYVANVLVIAGVLCQDRNPMVRSAYLGFTGDLSWIDTQGTDDPTYDGVGSRWFLTYLTAADFS